MSESIEFTIESSKRTLFGGKELWRYRELFYFFTWRDIKIKYKQTVLGFLWAVLQPLFMMVIFTLFFGRALNIPSQDLPYPIFVFSGLLFWNMFSTGLTSSANSMVNNSAIIKKIYFPRLIIPTSAILVALFDFFMAFVLFIPLLLLQATNFICCLVVLAACCLRNANGYSGAWLFVSCFECKIQRFSLRHTLFDSSVVFFNACHLSSYVTQVPAVTICVGSITHVCCHRIVSVTPGRFG
jgi:ABC-type polysaccharide/polyol phosphate export permease